MPARTTAKAKKPAKMTALPLLPQTHNNPVAAVRAGKVEARVVE
jgi:hypothetical protein